ncbi:MAG: hypothetical protein N4A61_15330 [Pelagimonas sp.]|jgi:hypothetical protein|nr:hypothetical protein [Pelagimonas sp.]
MRKSLGSPSLLIMLCFAVNATSPQAETTNHIDHVENVPVGTRVLVCQDDFTFVDELVPPNLALRDDLESADAPAQDSPFELVIMSHRSAVSKSGCKALTQREEKFVYTKYEEILFLRIDIAHKFPAYADALRRASCQPLYGMKIGKRKAVSIALFERDSKTLREAAYCAKRVLEYIKTDGNR